MTSCLEVDLFLCPGGSLQRSHPRRAAAGEEDRCVGAGGASSRQVTSRLCSSSHDCKEASDWSSSSARFYLALTCGRGTSREPPPDVALELCVRFRDRQVLRRACLSGVWGDAERDVPFFPFIRDQPFKVGTPKPRPLVAGGGKSLGWRREMALPDGVCERVCAAGDPLRAQPLPRVCGRRAALPLPAPADVSGRRGHHVDQRQRRHHQAGLKRTPPLVGLALLMCERISGTFTDAAVIKNTYCYDQ